MKPPNNARYDFVCYGCGAYSDPTGGFTCSRCSEPLSIHCLAEPEPALFRERPVSLWTYADMLPIRSAENIVSLGEGATPLLDAPRIAAELGLGRLWIKNEMANPTGSFKDRQVSVGISHAREIGADTVAVVSSGNVACAASAYAARAGIRSILLMHGHAATGKRVQASVYGGNVIQVDTPSASAVFDLCIQACRAWGWYHLSTAGMYEPFNVEGAKTIAYELYQQTAPGAQAGAAPAGLPDWIVAPVGGGGLLGGIWRGFLDLKRLGLIDAIPRLAGVQATGCAPLYKAIDLGTCYLDTLKDPWPNPHTIAGGIADDILFDGHTVLPAIRTTNGAAIAVEDPAILDAQKALASREGLLCEPTAAVVIAALAHLPEITPETRVCCIVTGNGIKDLAGLEKRAAPPIAIGPSIKELDRALQRI